MRYRITFTHGQVHEFDGDRLEDDGLRVSIWSGNDLVIRFQDSDVAATEAIELPPIETGDTYGHRNGHRLYDAAGRMIAAYRTTNAAKIA